MTDEDVDKYVDSLTLEKLVRTTSRNNVVLNIRTDTYEKCKHMKIGDILNGNKNCVQVAVIHHFLEL